MRPLVWIKGAGDLATGVAFRLRRAGFAVFLSDLPQPLCVRRLVAFAEAIPAGCHTVEGYTAVCVADVPEVEAALSAELVPVAADPDGRLGRRLGCTVLVDAVMAKRNLGTTMADAPIVVGLGPGFVAGRDCHAVVETQRGHTLGRVYYQGAALPDTGIPGEMAGVGTARVVRAPVAGRFHGLVEIGVAVKAGDALGVIVPPEGGLPSRVEAGVGGVLRGLIRSGVNVSAGLKVGDVDPTGDTARCRTISDKALAVGGGVLEAMLGLARRVGKE